MLLVCGCYAGVSGGSPREEAQARAMSREGRGSWLTTRQSHERVKTEPPEPE